MPNHPTLVETIVAEHAGRARVHSGDIVVVSIDYVYLQDGNTPTVSRYFEEYGFDQLFDPNRIIAYFDHAVLPADRNMTDRVREAEQFVERFGLQLRRPGEGISHVVALEEGVFAPGRLVIAADSHACTGGVVQCLSLGMGASDVVAAMVTGHTWLRVPETVWLRVNGRPGPLARAKDVMLYALATYGQRPFLGKALEWCGGWVNGLNLDEAATVANMAIEQGAECCFLPPGPGRPAGMRPIEPAGESPEHCLPLDVEGLQPYVAEPHDPCRARPLHKCAGVPINYVFIGTCANARLVDLREAAGVLRRAPVAPGVHCVVTPGSRGVYLAALKEGLIETFVRAGAVVTPPGCGACVGTGGPIPASGDNVLSTGNRNFRGRMGNPDARIWLASPLVAARGATLGRVPACEELE